MRIAKDLVADLRQAGGALALVGERLNLTYPKDWRKEQREDYLKLIRSQKQEVIALIVAESMPRAERQSDARCGKEYCAGCYEVAPGVYLHPPRSAYNHDGK